MPILNDEVLDAMTSGKSKYMPVTLKEGVVKIVTKFAKEKNISKSDAINRAVAEWDVMRRKIEAEQTELA